MAIRTLGGKRVEIQGEFESVRIATDDPDSDHEREVVLRPPFAAARFESSLFYRRLGEPAQHIDLADVRQVEVVQRDDARTAIVVTVVSAAVVLGAVGGGSLQDQDREGGAVLGALLLGGLSVAFVVPMTKYY